MASKQTAAAATQQKHEAIFKQRSPPIYYFAYDPSSLGTELMWQIRTNALMVPSLCLMKRPSGGTVQQTQGHVVNVKGTVPH